MACCFYGLVRCLCLIGQPCLASVRAALAPSPSSGLSDFIVRAGPEGWSTRHRPDDGGRKTETILELALMRPPPHLIPGALRRTQKRRKVRVVPRFDEAAHGVAHLRAEGY